MDYQTVPYIYQVTYTSLVHVHKHCNVGVGYIIDANTVSIVQPLPLNPCVSFDPDLACLQPDVWSLSYNNSQQVCGVIKSRHLALRISPDRLTMPILTIHTNVGRTSIPEAFVDEASAALAQAIGKKKEVYISKSRC